MTPDDMIKLQADRLIELRKELAVYEHAVKRIRYWHSRMGAYSGVSNALRELNAALGRVDPNGPTGDGEDDVNIISYIGAEEGP